MTGLSSEAGPPAAAIADTAQPPDVSSPSEARDLLFSEMCALIFDPAGAGSVPWKFRPSQSGHCSKIGNCHPAPAPVSRPAFGRLVRLLREGSRPPASCLSVSRGRNILFLECGSLAAAFAIITQSPTFPCRLSRQPLIPLTPASPAFSAKALPPLPETSCSRNSPRPPQTQTLPFPHRPGPAS